MSRSPTDVIRQSPMSVYQYAIIALCVLSYASDGVDVVTLSYAAPALMKEWGSRPRPSASPIRRPRSGSPSAPSSCRRSPTRSADAPSPCGCSARW
ncbi:hypothetical protein ACFSTI_14235 [Rhizorhabdus histidinilytica]